MKIIYIQLSYFTDEGGPEAHKASLWQNWFNYISSKRPQILLEKALQKMIEINLN